MGMCNVKKDSDIPVPRLGTGESLTFLYSVRRLYICRYECGLMDILVASGLNIYPFLVVRLLAR
jgi:hypothetical protein